MPRTSRLALASIAAALLIAPLAAAQQTPAPTPGDDSWTTKLVPTAGSPEAKAYAKAQKSRQQVEKDLKKLKAQYFHGVRNTETRQLGILKLREYTDPAIFPSLIKLFGDEGTDVQDALLDHFRELKTDEADAAITWVAVFGKDKAFRAHATDTLKERTREAGEVTNRVKWVVSLGLRDHANDNVAAAAQLAQALQLYDAIPMLINAQVTQSAGPTRADDGGEPALAYILVGTQQAYVAGLTPVVGDNAVAFDPRLGVVTNGVVLRVIDAVVITYRTEVNAALIGLSTQGWGGQSTAGLGWDQQAWRVWYNKEFLPYRHKVEAELAAASSTKPATTPAAPTQPSK
jgi:hypothetical protein